MFHSIKSMYLGAYETTHKLPLTKINNIYFRPKPFNSTSRSDEHRK